MKIGFLGDSVTQGCFEIYTSAENVISATFDYQAVYHARLKQMLEYVFIDKNINVINAGKGGDSAEQGLARLEKEILSISPDIAVVCFGLNDVTRGEAYLNTYTKSLEEIFKRLRSEVGKVIFMTPNMMNTYVHKNIGDFYHIAQDCAKAQNSGRLDLFIDAAKEVCVRNEIVVCDAYSRWIQLHKSGIDTTAHLSNYINHPTREMHWLFANMLFEKIIFEEKNNV